MNDASTKPALRLIDMVFVAVRFPVIIALLPFGLLAGCMKILGEWGDWLNDTCRDASSQITMALNPRAWEMLKKYKEERDMYKRGEAFWKTEAERLLAERAKGQS